MSPKPLGTPRIRPSATGGLPPKIRRQPVKAACNACRSRKTKCDANRPNCHECINKGSSCEYDTVPGQTRAAAQGELTNRLQADNASLLEIFWHIQTTSAYKAQDFLQFLRSAEQVDIPSLKKWFQPDDPMDERISSQGAGLVHSSARHNLHPKVPSAVYFHHLQDESTPNFSEDISHVLATPTHPNLSLLSSQLWTDRFTIGSVKSAIDTFLQSAGMLFHVFTKKQVDAIIEDVLAKDHYHDNFSFLDVLQEETSIHRNAQLADLCGMASIGTLYLRLPSQNRQPPAEAAELLYSLTKLMLDSSIQVHPLRAMKVCALLAMYNIVLKATVAFAYIEFGLGLGRTYRLSADECPPQMQQHEFLDYKKVWRSLLLFSGWLSASLGYISREEGTEVHLPEETDNILTGDIIQGQLVKVTIIKATIIRTMDDDGLVDDTAVDKFRQALRSFYEELPSTMAIGTASNVQWPAPLRPNIFYLHLFYLSAMQLLHRRVMANKDRFSHSQTAKAAVREGLMAAKKTARILALMRLEGAIVQLCWLCIYSSYNSAILILQAAVQKVLTGYPSSTWIADLSLVDICVQTLHFCAQVDEIAFGFENRVCRYVRAVQDAVDGKLNEDASENANEGASVDYLFVIPAGNTDLHRAARDLLHLVHKPFSSSLELISQDYSTKLQMRETLVNWAEAAVGSPQEWAWELQQCGSQGDAETANTDGSFQILDIMSKLSPGRFVSTGSNTPWAAVTPHAF